MFHRAAIWKCSAAAAASAQTLSAWLARLAEEVEAMPTAGKKAQVEAEKDVMRSACGTSTTPSSPCGLLHTQETLHQKIEQLWREIEDAAAHANALRETDTLFSVIHHLTLKRQYPVDVQLWSRIARLLLPYGGIESRSVLLYPGRPEEAYRRDSPTHLGRAAIISPGPPHGPNQADDGPDVYVPRISRSSHPPPPPYHVYPSREILLLTGGVVPLSARVPCGDGRMIALFLRNFCCCMEEQLNAIDAALDREESLPAAASSPSPPQQLSTRLSFDKILNVVRDVTDVVITALSLNAATLQLERLLLPALLEFMQLLHHLDLRAYTSVTVPSSSARGGEAREGLPVAADRPAPPLLLQRLAQGLSEQAISGKARGARVVLDYLCSRFEATLEQPRVRALQESLLRTATTVSAAADEMYWAQQRYFLSLTRSCAQAICSHYHPVGSDTEVASGQRAATHTSVITEDLFDTVPMHPSLQTLYDHVDALFQKNTNAGDPLRLGSEEAAQIREVVTTALLRALRVEEAAPDAYLRRALEVVDRVPASMAIEGELIAGKVRLLELDSDTVNEEGRTAIYADLLTSLRSLVDMRPRFARSHVANTSGGDSGDGGVAGDAAGSADDYEKEGDQFCLDAATQELLQRAHIDVITAFCAAHQDTWCNEAYNIVVAHKYHGLKITKEVIVPLLEVFSRRGDGRVFNLVDLCVLYSNEPVDMTTITLLFRTCAAAGDHYRARTLLQLLNEIIPGFLVKCPAAVRESLEELKLLAAPPPHLFLSAEEELVQSALGEERRPVPRLPGGV